MANEVEITVKGRDQGAKKTADAAGKSIKRVGEIAQGIITAQLFQQIGQAAQRFLGNASAAGSDLGESMNAVNVVFKDSASGIKEIGETASESMGLSQRAFNDAAVRFSNFAKEVAGPGGDVTQVIRDITQRSSDFASVMNLEVGEAMRVFQSGLAGESEPLRRYGIDVSAATVQTFAYANGIAEAGQELTEAQKIQARYGIIMQETTEMAGDFANTSGDLANQQRILNAEWENAQATMGQALVPAMQLANAALIPMLQAFQDLPGPVQTVVSVLVVLGATILTVTSRIAPMIIAMQAAGISMQTLAARAAAATAALGPLAAAILVVGAATQEASFATQEAAKDTSKAADGLEEFGETGRVTGDVLRAFGKDLSILDFGLEQAAEGGKNAALGLGFTDKALAELVESGRVEAAEKAFERIADRAAGYGISQQELLDLLPEYADAQEEANAAAEEAAAAVDSATEANNEHLESLKAVAEQLKAQTDPVFALIQAQNDLKDAQNAVTEAEEEHGKKSPEYRAALRNEADAALAVLSAAGELGDEFTGDLSEAQKTMLRDAGISEEAIEQLAKDLRRAKRDADRLDGTRAQVEVNTRFTQTGRPPNPAHFPSGRFASGGIIGGEFDTTAQGGGPRGSRVLVGEQGPEVVDLPTGSRVIPSVDQATDRGQGGGGPLHIVFDLTSFGGIFEAALQEWFSKQMRTNDEFRVTVRGSR